MPSNTNTRSMSLISKLLVGVTLPYSLYMVLGPLRSYFDTNYYNQMSFGWVMVLIIIWAALFLGTALSLNIDFPKEEA